MGYLVIKGNNQTRSYSIGTGSPVKPYMKVGNGYLNLTAADTTGLRLNIRVGNAMYRPIASSTYTSSNSYHSTTRQSDYTSSSIYKTVYYGKYSTGSGTYTNWITGAQASTYSTSYCNNKGGNADACKAQAINGAQNFASANLTNVFRYSTASRSFTGTYNSLHFLKGATSATTYYTISTTSSASKFTTGNSTYFATDKFATTYACNFQTYDGGNYGTYTGYATCSGRIKKTHSYTRTYGTAVSNNSFFTTSYQTSKASTYTDYYYTQTSTGL